MRDPQAVAIVEQALAMLGGKDSQLRVRTAVIHGNQQTAGERAAASFLWEDDLSGKVPEFRKEIHSGSSVRLLVSGHGKASQQTDGKQKHLTSQVSWALPPLYLPGVVLARQLGNGSYSFQVIRDDSGLLHVRSSWNLNSVTALITTEDWYFDPVTQMPARVQYSLPSTQFPGQLRTASMEFSDFRTVSGIGVPFKVIGHGADHKMHAFAIENVQINTNIDSSHFELTGGQQ